ncbi:DUF448 domain-containing protein [Helicobacter cetorum]|uniref:YlxR domain-containing protein n=1 Tax=Helicobacter cetorum (strain ATCC BAA-429 / MIT 00-7128) TaxID=182217 RepID=I0EM11_HELC0|nr:DUF448 domain-containing protein [Helicobacter cetorum]AFI03980.1 hypothetical protein HCW_03505 [Helicobacter cetorum MIT 00-7128]
MRKNEIKIRMCVACRIRQSQDDLLRLKSFEGALIDFDGKGRSFYVCKDCLKGGEKKLLKAILRVKNAPKNPEKIITWIKEKSIV